MTRSAAAIVQGMNSLPYPVGEPFHSSAALKLGVTSRNLSKGVESGELLKLRHGWYCRTPAAEESRITAMRRQIQVALEQKSGDSVASHSSAALLYGLPLVDTARTTDVHLTGLRRSGGKRASGVILHTSPAPPDSVSVNGICATSVQRTVVDVARTAGFIPGVCVADAALHKKLITPADLAEEVEHHHGRVGAGTARAVAAFADGNSESPGESKSRCLMSMWSDVPTPRLQHEFRTASGRLVARTDFDWEGRLVGEFDGYVKYTGRRGRRGNGEDPSQVAWQEKRREDDLRSLGPIVIRWIWYDLNKPFRLRALILDGLKRAGLR